MCYARARQSSEASGWPPLIWAALHKLARLLISGGGEVRRRPREQEDGQLKGRQVRRKQWEFQSARPFGSAQSERASRVRRRARRVPPITLLEVDAI